MIGCGYSTIVVDNLWSFVHTPNLSYDINIKSEKLIPMHTTQIVLNK